MASCKICDADYNSEQHKPVVGTCGHSICHYCSTRVNGACPICRQHSFRNPVTNFDLLEQIENQATNGAQRPTTSQNLQRPAAVQKHVSPPPIQRPTPSQRAVKQRSDETLAQLLNDLNIADELVRNAQALEQAMQISLMETELKNMGIDSEDDQLLIALQESERTFAMEQISKNTESTRTPPQNYNDGRRLYIKNFGNIYDRETLRILFESFGPIVSLNTPMHPNQKLRGFGDVTYQNLGDAQSAMAGLNDHVLQKDRTLVVTRYIPKNECNRNM